MPKSPFADLTPDRILEAADESGVRATGRTTPLGALENRVFDVEREDGSRVVVKFYRPGRHATEAILDEHKLLLALAEDELPVVSPLPLRDGTTLRTCEDGHRYAVFPKAAGRSPDDLTPEGFERIGRLLARMHNVSAALSLPHRPKLSPDTYGTACLERIVQTGHLPPGTRGRYVAAVEHLVRVTAPLFEKHPSFVVHADCHRGNVLSNADGFFFLDFDDAASAPPVQDLWLLLPGRPEDCPEEVESWISGYETFRPFDVASLGLIEALRGLRYVRYAAWINDRITDPAFARAFPQFGTSAYWEGQTADVAEQVERLLDRA